MLRLERPCGAWIALEPHPYNVKTPQHASIRTAVGCSGVWAKYIRSRFDDVVVHVSLGLSAVAIFDGVKSGLMLGDIGLHALRG